MIIKVTKTDRSRWYKVGEEYKCERIYKNGNAIIVDHSRHERRIYVEYGHYEVINHKHYKRGFVTCEEIIEIEKDFANKMSIYDVSCKYDITTSLVHSLLENWKRLQYVGLGWKNESYFSEQEMIQGYKIPTFDELSESEKTIYSMK